MKFLFLLLMTICFSVTSAEARGSVFLEGGRLKIQYRLQGAESKGSLALREILVKDGFKVDGGFVKTNQALAPLELYNYLYENGEIVFTIFLPVGDGKIFSSMHEDGFLSFEGIAAERLFSVLRRHLPARELNNLEQYKFGDFSFCDRTKIPPIHYRCNISR